MFLESLTNQFCLSFSNQLFHTCPCRIERFGQWDINERLYFPSEVLLGCVRKDLDAYFPVRTPLGAISLALYICIWDCLQRRLKVISFLGCRHDWQCLRNN